jgi:hypothetical protein
MFRSILECPARLLAMVHAALTASFARMHKDSYSDWKATVVMGVAIVLLIASCVFASELASGKRLPLNNAWALIVAVLVTIAIHLVLTRSRLQDATVRFRKFSRKLQVTIVTVTWISVLGSAAITLWLSHLLIRSRGVAVPPW